MKKIILFLWFIFVAQSVLGQTFSGTGGTLGFFGYFNYKITTAGLPNLDGINLGVESIEINIKARNMDNVRLYLISPTGTRAVIADGWGNGVEVNGVIKFNMNPTNIEFRNWGTTTTPPATYFRPDVSFNGFSNGQNPNGEWTLQAEPRNIFGKAVSIVDWKITFGNQFINPAEPNDECTGAKPLELNIPLTEVKTNNFSSGINEINGDKVDGGGGASYTENTAWFSFIPQCSNDKIILENSDNTGMQIAIRSSCNRSLSSIKKYSSNARTGGETYTFDISNYVIGQKYFLVVDGQTGSYVYLKKILWEKGTIGCSVTATIATGAISNTNPYCAGQSITVPYTITGTFNSGNVFTAQLSDGNGSFTGPINIGTLASGASGSINATIPASTVQGTKYKIRVVSSNAAITGSDNGLDLQINNLPSTMPNFTSGSTTVCENQQNVLYQVSTNSTYTLEWKLPTEATLANTNTDLSSIAINYTTNGGNLEARYKNSCGLGNAAIKPIIINKKPTAVTFLSGASTICANAQNILYKPTTVANAAGYSWKLPSGATVSSALVDSSEIKVNFGSIAGQIAVIATNDCGESTPFVKNISLGTLPMAPAGLAIPSEVCSGDRTAILKVNSASGSIMKWQLPMGTTIKASDADSTQITIKAGNNSGNVTVAAYNGCGENTQKANGFLKIISLPAKPVLVSSPSFICTNFNSPISIAVQPDANATYFQWKFPKGYSNIKPTASDSSSLKVTPSREAGNITVIAKNNCGISNPTIIPINLDSLPAAPTLVSNEKILCVQDPNTATAIVNTKSGITYTWVSSPTLLVNSAPADSSSINISLKSLQTLGKAKVFAINKCGKSLLSGNFVLKLLNQPASIQMTYADTAICINSKASFKASAINGGELPVFSWYVNEVMAQQGSDSVFTIPFLAANATVYCTLLSSLSCAGVNPISTAKYIVKVSTAVTPTISINSTDTTLCQGNTTNFVAFAANAGNPEFAWYINNVKQQNETGSTFLPKTLTNNDVVKATAMSSLACATVNTVTSAPITIKIVAAIIPTISIESNKDSVCFNEDFTINATLLNAGTNYSLSWYMNDMLATVSKNNFSLDTSLNQSSIIYAKLTTSQPCATESEIISNKKPVYVIPSLVIAGNINGDMEVCVGDSGKIYLINGLLENNYLWKIPSIANGQSVSNSINLTFENIGIDTLKVAMGNRCGSSNTSLLVINVNECTPIFIPNVFSTVGDGGWPIEGLGEFAKAEISVFNRWGNEVYFSRGYSKKWDGKYQSKQLPMGTYYFILNLKDKANRVFTGSVTILNE